MAEDAAFWEEDHAAALEACLAQLSRTFEAQVELARTVLQAHTVQVAEGAVERLAAAVRIFDHDLHEAASDALSRQQDGDAIADRGPPHKLSAPWVLRPAAPQFADVKRPRGEPARPAESVPEVEVNGRGSEELGRVASGYTVVASRVSARASEEVIAARSSNMQPSLVAPSRRNSCSSMNWSSKDFDEDASVSDMQSAASDRCGLDMVKQKGTNRGSGCCAKAFIRGVLSPQYTGRLAWDVMVIILVLMDAIVLPFQLAYKGRAKPDGFDRFWLWFTTSLFVIDMVLSFFTAYEAGPRDEDVPPGTLITNKARIAKRYLRGWFTIDLMSTVPWQQVAEVLTGGAGDGSSSQVAKLTKLVKFMRFLRLMRMLRLAKLGAIWERIEVHLGSMLLVQTLALFRVIFAIVAICHWNACIFWMVGLPRSIFTELLSEEAQATYEAQPHWTTVVRKHGPLEDHGWTWLEKDTTEAYVFCFYWTLGVMRTMPAEVQPVNLPERIFVLVFMFFALSAFAITVAQITQAYFKFFERRRVFTEELAAVRMHLRTIGASDALQRKVKAYLRHIFSRRKIQAKERALLESLPPPLKRRLAITQKLSHLQKLEVVQLAPEKLHAGISDLAEVCDLLPGVVLSRAGQMARFAWVIVTGRVQVMETDLGSSSTVSAVVPTRSWLMRAPQQKTVDIVDQECLLSGEPYHSQRTIAVVEVAEVMRIDRSHFQAFLSKFGSTWLRDTGSDELGCGEDMDDGEETDHFGRGLDADQEAVMQPECSVDRSLPSSGPRSTQSRTFADATVGAMLVSS